MTVANKLTTLDSFSFQNKRDEQIRFNTARKHCGIRYFSGNPVKNPIHHFN